MMPQPRLAGLSLACVQCVMVRFEQSHEGQVLSPLTDTPVA